MKKLNLEKQKITTLSSTEMRNINGGNPIENGTDPIPEGIRRSNHRTGNCNYSDRNPVECTCHDDNGNEFIYRMGCS